MNHNANLKISIGCVSIVLPIGYLLQIFYVLSFFHSTFSDAWYLRVAFYTLLGVNVYANLFAIVRVGSNGNTTLLPTVQKADMRYCPACCRNVPPRAYHCPGLQRSLICTFKINPHLIYSMRKMSE